MGAGEGLAELQIVLLRRYNLLNFLFDESGVGKFFKRVHSSLELLKLSL